MRTDKRKVNNGSVAVRNGQLLPAGKTRHAFGDDNDAESSIRFTKKEAVNNTGWSQKVIQFLLQEIGFLITYDIWYRY